MGPRSMGQAALLNGGNGLACLGMAWLAAALWLSSCALQSYIARGVHTGSGIIAATSYLRVQNVSCIISMQSDKILMKFNVYMIRKKCLVSQEEKYFLKMIFLKSRIHLSVNNICNAKVF